MLVIKQQYKEAKGLSLSMHLSPEALEPTDINRTTVSRLCPTDFGFSMLYNEIYKPSGAIKQMYNKHVWLK